MQWLPFELFHCSSDAAMSAIIVANKSSSSSLDAFQVINVSFQIQIPNCLSHYRSNEGDIGGLFEILFTALNVKKYVNNDIFHIVKKERERLEKIFTLQ